MKCPKCGIEMVWGYTWIEHQGIGHPGFQTWFCTICNYVEPIEQPDFEVTIYNNKEVVR